MRVGLRHLVASLGLVLVTVPVSAQVVRSVGDAEPRFALIIGNSDYDTAPLDNPVNDARLMADILGRLGFEVIPAIDATQREMRRAVIDFGDRLEGGGVGLFYYAGHGIQVDGQNYMIPVDAEISREAHVAVEGVPVNQVLARMEGARNRLNILILDACRNNPFARSFRSPNNGLAQTSAPAGTYIAYATAPNEVARDGDAGNSPFTLALAEAIETPGQQIEDVFKQVRQSVQDETFGAQVPWTSSSITGEFFFTPEEPQVASLPPQPQTFEAAERAFEVAERIGTIAAYRAIARNYLGSVYADLAEAAIARLEEGSDSQTAALPHGDPPDAAPPGPKTIEDALNLTREDRRLVQYGLNELSHAAGSVDGLFGDRTRAAIRAYQLASTADATGYLTAEQATHLIENGRIAPRGLDELAAKLIAETAPEDKQQSARPGEFLPEGSVEDQYNFARSFLMQRDFERAEVALRTFVEDHPEKSALAGNAQYWLGETYYVRDDFLRAARAFAEGNQRFPNSSKAPDNLLKLGMSLAKLERPDDACLALSKLRSDYPDAHVNVLARAQREFAQLGCGWR